MAISERAEGPHQTGAKPNIIFILTDDQRWDALGYAGNNIIHTPEMDRLAQEGVWFRNAVVTTPICSASRASIFTGLHERTHRYTFQTGPLREEYIATSYPVMLKEAGYFTGFFGKFGVNVKSSKELFDVFDNYDRNNQFPDRRGYFYKTLHGDTVHLTRYTGQQALDFIDEAPRDKPFCLSLSFSAPHAHDGAPKQYFWQEESASLYSNQEMPGPELAEDKFFQQLPLPVREGFNRLRWTWRFDTPEKYQHSVKGYYRMIYEIDQEIAKIRNKLKEKGLDKNSVIILMGDNGYFLGERQLAGKWLMYDNSVRVPLIIMDPRQNLHKDLDVMALNIDVPATILDLAGIKMPDLWQGKSLLPVVTGKSRTLNRDTILIEHLWESENIPPSEGVRTDEWKYFRYVNDKSADELYHLASDPKEIKNLVDDPKYVQVVNRLKRSLDLLGERYADCFSGTPTGLTVEFIRDPSYSRINDSHPEFGWVLPQTAQFQKAYQILVSSDKGLIDSNIGDIWNSGQVRSSQSNNVELPGALKPNSTYYWKVRIFDQDNRLSDYSEVQKFTTGTFTGMITTENYFQVERISPVQLRKQSDGSWFIDFGKAAFGTLELQYTPKRSETVTVHLGEKLSDGRIDRNPGGSIRYQKVELKVTPKQSVYAVELIPDERNTNAMAIALPDSFPVVMPFRYAEVSGIESLTSDNVRQIAWFGYFDSHSSDFRSSDDILNQIWDLCKYSMKATSFAGYYIDGERERIPYEADAYINQLSHYATDNEYAIARRTMEYFIDHPTWPTEWQLHVALLFYADYMYTGNTELIEKYYEILKVKTLMDLQREDGLISSANTTTELLEKLGFDTSDPKARLEDIVDWPPADKDVGWDLATEEGERDGFIFMPYNTVVNSFYCENMRIMSVFAGLMGKWDESEEFRLLHQKAKNAINAKLFDKNRGVYVDGEGTSHASLHANMLPLAFNQVPEDRIPKVVDFIKSRGMACSVYGAQYLLEGLYKAGAADYALKLMTATHDRSWYNAIKVGSTITFEAWDMKYKPNADWNHAWGAAPANIIGRYLWGIQPKRAGFDRVSIKPQMGNLINSSIVMPTIKGQIKCEYRKLNNRLVNYSIELPGNMVGEFNVDLSPESILSLNDKPVNPLFGSVRLQPGMNNITIRINSF